MGSNDEMIVMPHHHLRIISSALHAMMIRAVIILSLAGP